MTGAALSTTRDPGARVRFEVDDGAVAGLHWRREGAPRLLFCHATGFCASAYRAMLAPLAAAFGILAIDLRGHGRTNLPTAPKTLKNWAILAGDVGAVLDQWSDGARVALAGHSLGAVVATLAARGRADVSVLSLIEPVAVHPALAMISSTPAWPYLANRIPLVRGARGRRSRWPQRSAAAESYARKALFATWADGVLGDYLEDGLIDDKEGVRLACEPEWEAAVFAAQANDFWAAIRAAEAPVRVLAAGLGDTTVSAGARAHFRRLGAFVDVENGEGHLLPMANPRRAADFIFAGL